MSEIITLTVDLKNEEQVIAGLQNIDALALKLNNKPINLKIEGLGSVNAGVSRLATTVDGAGKQIQKQVSTITDGMGTAVKIVDKYNKKTGEMERVSATVTQKLNEQSKVTHLLGDSIDRVITKMAAWQILGNVISGVMRSFKDAGKTIKEVDTELANIRKVTDMSQESLKQLGDTAYKTASQYGVSAQSYLENVTAFAKAGYKDLAQDLGELAIKTQLVGDVNEEVAHKFLLSTDAAYKMGGNVKELSVVLDKANAVENNYATSIEKMAAGMPLVASVAATAHMSVDETLAAIGTITAQTQESGTMAARALRALILNILGDTKTEIEDGVTWTEQEISNLNDVLWKYSAEAMKAAEATGKVVNPMEAIAGLSKAYKEGVLSEAKLLEMATDLGGKLRSNQLIALIKGFDMFNAQLQTMAGSAGSADKEMSVMLDTWERKTAILKNTWTEFVTNFLNTDLIKGGLDALTGFIKILNSDTGTLVLKLSGIALGLGGIAKAAKAILASKVFSNLKAFIALTAEAGLGQSLAALGPAGKAGLIIAGIAAIAAAIDHFVVTAAEAKEKAAELQEQFNQDFGTGSRYDELIKKQGELNLLEQQELNTLEAIRREKERSLEAARDEAYEAWQKQYGTGKYNIFSNMRGDEKSLVEFRNAVDLATQDFARNLDAKAYREKMDSIISTNAEAVAQLKEFQDEGRNLSSEQKAMIQSFDLVSTAAAEEGGSLNQYAVMMTAYFTAQGYSIEDATEAAATATEKFATGLDSLQDKLDKLDDKTKINVEAEQALANINAVSAAIDNLKAKDATIHIGAPIGPGGGFRPGSGSAVQGIHAFGAAAGTRNSPGGPTLVNDGTGPEIISANGYAYIAGGGKPAVINLPKGASVLTAEESRSAFRNSGIARLIPAYASGMQGAEGAGQRSSAVGALVDSALKKLNELVNVYSLDTAAQRKEQFALRRWRSKSGRGSLTPKAGGYSGGYSGGGGIAAPDFKALENSLDDTLAALDAQAQLAENEKRFVDAMKIYGKAQNEISALVDKYRAAGYAPDSKEVVDLLNKGYAYGGKQQSDYEKLQNDLIEALKGLKDSVDKENVLAEKQAAVDEAREILANTQANRNIRIFNPVTGQWEWVANAKNIENAQKRLEDSEKSLRDEQVSQNLEAIENAKPEDLMSMILSPALKALIGAGTAEQQQAIINALGGVSGGVDYATSTAGRTRFNQGGIDNSININGLDLSNIVNKSTTIGELTDILRSLATT